MKGHMHIRHAKKCELCPGDESYSDELRILDGKRELEKHMQLVHTNSTALPESEMEALSSNANTDILLGPTTPRKEALEKYELRLRNIDRNKYK